MEREKLICDKRSGCVAIYKESKKDDIKGCHYDDERNIAYSSKGTNLDGFVWYMDSSIQRIYQEMVDAYNEKYNLL